MEHRIERHRIHIIRSPVQMVGIETRLWAEMSEVRIATGARDFYLLQNVQTALQPTK
jgi:hypothetical protein